MNRLLAALCLAVASPLLAADDPSLVQKFLESGELAVGEQTLERELETDPQNDQLQFGLGVLQFVRSVERLGQGLYVYGAKPTDGLFLRLPVPQNDDPMPINAYRFRRMLDDFRGDLSIAEATLAKITAENVELRLRLADIHLDLDADGKPTDRFSVILDKIFRGRRLDFLQGNSRFEVNFDRGDVAWLRAYCHLLMAIVDAGLSVIDDGQFETWSDRAFAKPIHAFEGTDEERLKKSQELAQHSLWKEPQRLHRMRLHLIQVAELNAETWKFIRAETDDDHEWLPNPRQTGVLRLPVRHEMVTTWLNMMAEFKLLLEGERLLPNWLNSKFAGKGLNLKRLLDDPPAKLENGQDIPEKYFTEGKEINAGAFFNALQLFMDPSLVGYPVWFN